MNFDLFLLGIKIGLSVAIPIGPICLLCIRKSLTENLAVGIAMALGTATADMIYAFLGGLSIATITTLLTTYELHIQLAGVAVIFYLGITALWHGIPTAHNNECTTSTLLQTYFSMIILTLSSPMTILLFAGNFAGVGATMPLHEYINLAPLAFGVFVAAAAWFSALSATVIIFRSWFTRAHLAAINTIAGISIIAFGLQRLYYIFLG
jgi:threonine/homoserine/homoserine lactone efflux protein